MASPSCSNLPVNSWTGGGSCANAGIVAVACPVCLTMLDDAVKETESQDLAVQDVAIMLRDAVLDGKA